MNENEWNVSWGLFIACIQQLQSAPLDADEKSRQLYYEIDRFCKKFQAYGINTENLLQIIRLAFQQGDQNLESVKVSILRPQNNFITRNPLR